MLSLLRCVAIRSRTTTYLFIRIFVIFLQWWIFDSNTLWFFFFAIILFLIYDYIFFDDSLQTIECLIDSILLLMIGFCMKSDWFRVILRKPIEIFKFTFAHLKFIHLWVMLLCCDKAFLYWWFSSDLDLCSIYRSLDDATRWVDSCLYLNTIFLIFTFTILYKVDCWNDLTSALHVQVLILSRWAINRRLCWVKYNEVRTLRWHV